MSQPCQIVPHRRIMLFERLREMMPPIARADRNEKQLSVLLRMYGREHGLAPRQGDWRGWQASARIGVVRRIGNEITGANIAVVVLSEPIDHGRIRLQPHPLAQPAYKHSGDAWTLRCQPGLLLDYGG